MGLRALDARLVARPGMAGAGPGRADRHGGVLTLALRTSKRGADPGGDNRAKARGGRALALPWANEDEAWTAARAARPGVLKAPRGAAEKGHEGAAAHASASCALRRSCNIVIAASRAVERGDGQYCGANVFKNPRLERSTSAQADLAARAPTANRVGRLALAADPAPHGCAARRGLRAPMAGRPRARWLGAQPD